MANASSNKNAEGYVDVDLEMEQAVAAIADDLRGICAKKGTEEATVAAISYIAQIAYQSNFNLSGIESALKGIKHALDFIAKNTPSLAVNPLDIRKPRA